VGIELRGNYGDALFINDGFVCLERGVAIQSIFINPESGSEQVDQPNNNEDEDEV